MKVNLEESPSVQERREALGVMSTPVYLIILLYLTLEPQVASPRRCSFSGTVRSLCVRVDIHPAVTPVQQPGQRAHSLNSHETK